MKNEMTEQERKELELFMTPRTPEQEAEWQAEIERDTKEAINEFIDTHDYMEAPSLQTKQAGAWTRKNIVLDSWNQYINFEARMSEYIGIHPEGKGFRRLNNTRRCDLALGFAHFFLAAMEAQVKMFNEEAAKENEPIETKE